MDFILSDLKKGSTAHLVGIGGAGMSAIATVLLQMGYRVEGSDLKESANVQRLRNLGAVVGIGHRTDNLGSAKVVISSSAVLPDNPEILEARRLGIPLISRARMLSEIMATRKGIAVAGTHGKTTTSSLITQMLLGCGADPSFLIGGELNEIGSNAHYSSGEYLVAEADESDGSLLLLRPEYTVLTNVEWDHPDYFDSVEHTERIFREFLELLPSNGFAVICGDDPHARGVGLDFKLEGGTALFMAKVMRMTTTLKVSQPEATAVDIRLSTEVPTSVAWKQESSACITYTTAWRHSRWDISLAFRSEPRSRGLESSRVCAGVSSWLERITV